ncbi:ac111 [Erannis ankeraria nucleopolyhedrovirus]|uniref:ac111 n=1 Tax=Erannis ankeraria nucleopolyhedrovirus TaxID=2913600 RepID=UPI00117AB77C|nr:ac111 [Erannis ankeraria nucleopolyhedrovirus]UJZ89060.1 ac111 [Erannis ankeraria nucleopolyhedrovirus]
MDNHSVHNFYNNNRVPFKPTTLHDGNIKQSTYENVTYIRRLMCREHMPGKSDHKFNNCGYNKENKSNGNIG